MRERIKKFFAGILSAAMAMTSMQIGSFANAASGVTVAVEKKYVTDTMAGKNVTLGVSLDGTSENNSYKNIILSQITIEYEDITYKSITDGILTDVNCDDNGMSLSVTTSYDDFALTIDSDEDLFDLTFTLPENIEDGDSFTVNVTECVFIDSDGQQYDVGSIGAGGIIVDDSKKATTTEETTATTTEITIHSEITESSETTEAVVSEKTDTTTVTNAPVTRKRTTKVTTETTTTTTPVVTTTVTTTFDPDKMVIKVGSINIKGSYEEINNNTNKTLVIPIEIYGNKGFKSATVALSYNGVSFASVVNSKTGAPISKASDGGGYCVVKLGSMTAESGTLFKLKVNTPSTIEPSTNYNIKVMDLSTEFLDEDGNEEEFEYVNGGIFIGEKEAEVTTTCKQAEIDVANLEYDVNEESRKIDVPVSIKNSSGIGSYEFYVDYDDRLKIDTSEYTNGYSVKEAENGGSIIHQSAVIADSDKEGMKAFKVDVSYADQDSEISEDGEFLTLHFVLPDDVISGDFYAIDLSIKNQNDGFARNITKVSDSGITNIVLPYYPMPVIENGGIDIVGVKQTTTTTTTTTVTDEDTETTYYDSSNEPTIIIPAIPYNGDYSDLSVDVPISISNNPGFLNYTMTLKYDSRLTLDTSKDNSGVKFVANNLIFYPSIKNDDTVDNGMKTLEIECVYDENYFNNGTFVTLHFTLPKDANLNDVFKINVDDMSLEQKVQGNVLNIENTDLDNGEIFVISNNPNVTQTTTTTFETTGAITGVTTDTSVSTVPETTTTFSESTVALKKRSSLGIFKNVIQVEQVSATPGSTVDVNIYYINQVTGFCSTGFVISFDKGLEYVNYSCSNDLSSTFGVYNADYSKDKKGVSFACANASADKTKSNSKPYYTITVKIPSDAKVGTSYNIGVDVVYLWTYRNGDDEISLDEISAMDGSVNVISPAQVTTTTTQNSKYANQTTVTQVNRTSHLKLGDANLDNVVNSKDAVLVLKEYSKWMINKSCKQNLQWNADVNFDFDYVGRYDAKDATFILQYYANVMSRKTYNGKMEYFMISKGYNPPYTWYKYE